MAFLRAALRRLLSFLGFGRPAPAPHLAPGATALPPATPAPATPAPLPHPIERPMLGDDRAVPGPAIVAMPQLMALAGEFPTRGDGGANGYFTTGMIQTFAGATPAYGAPRTQGQTLPIMNPLSNEALFSVLGVNFGGDPPTSLALPNLDGRAAIGGQEIGMLGQGTLTMTWLIATGASTVAPFPGTLVMFGGNFAPDGWAICDGSTLPIQNHIPLFQAIGTAFGGNGENIFLLPNLQNGAAPVGVGQGPGRAPVSLGQQIPGPIPGLGINYLIALEGAYPPTDGPGAFPPTGQFLGQVIAYAGNTAPAGWAFCDGSLLPIENNAPLFELIGTTYGGDGETTVALPDLRGLMVTGLAG
jgi:microcystin-dependent protein